jgi:hypothetical protein
VRQLISQPWVAKQALLISGGLGVVFPPPQLDGYLRLLQQVGKLSIQQFISQDG